MDGVDDLDAAGLEDLGQLADRVLGLGDREAVAGHHDDLLGVRQHDRGVVHVDLADRAAAGPRHCRALVALAATEAADHDVQDRAVHGVGHELGQDGARGTDEGARDDEHRVADHEAGHRRGRARERVQEADDDGHVRAADGQHERDAEDDRGAEDDDQEGVGDGAVEREHVRPRPAPG